MNRKKKIIGSLILFLFMIIVGNTIKVQAASTSITGSKTVTQGESVTITASVTAGAWNLTLSGAGQSKGLVGQTPVIGNSSASTSIKFSASNVGTYTFTLKGDITDFDTDKTSTVNKTCIITVKAKETPVTPPSGGNTGGSTNGSGGSSSTGGSSTSGGSTSSASAELKMLATSPVDFRGFKSASSGPYKITVENNVTSVNVSATPKDSKAKISISGNKNLDVGTNKVSVTVTSSDGKNKKTYVIYVTRKSGDGDEETPPNQIDEEEKAKLGLSAIILDEGYSLTPEFKTDVYEYTVELNEDLKEFPINAIATQEDAKIEITGNKELEEGENIVTIKVTSADGKETVEYKVKVIKNLNKQVLAPVLTKTKTTPLDFNSYNEIEKYSIATIVLISLICLIGIITVILEYKNTKLALVEGAIEEYDGYEPLMDTTKDNFNYGETFIDEEEPRKRGRSKGKHS